MARNVSSWMIREPSVDFDLHIGERHRERRGLVAIIRSSSSCGVASSQILYVVLWPDAPCALSPLYSPSVLLQAPLPSSALFGTLSETLSHFPRLFCVFFVPLFVSPLDGCPVLSAMLRALHVSGSVLSIFLPGATKREFGSRLVWGCSPPYHMIHFVPRFLPYHPIVSRQTFLWTNFGLLSPEIGLAIY